MNSNYNEAQCASPRLLQVGDELSNLNSAIMDLHDAIEALRDRLSPITVPVDSAAKNSAVSLAKAQSQLAQEIGCRAGQVCGARDKIRELLQSLDL